MKCHVCFNKNTGMEAPYLDSTVSSGVCRWGVRTGLLISRVACDGAAVSAGTGSVQLPISTYLCVQGSGRLSNSVCQSGKIAEGQKLLDFLFFNRYVRAGG